MTLIDKIKQSIEGATGMPFLYHAAGELNELIARCKSLPVAYSFLIDSGTIDDVNGRYHERVTLAVMFCDKTEFDFNALENEEIIDRMKEKAYKWMSSLRMSNTLHVVSVNNTQRLYDNTTDVLTGFAVNITLEDVAGVGECELPQVVIDVDKNGSYDVVGVDKVRVSVLPKMEELEVTQNGEYLPPTDIAGFRKVSVNVQPVLDELTITANGEYSPQDGVDGFSKVTAEFDTSSLPKVKVSALKVTDSCINDEGRWEGEQLIDTSVITSFQSIFENNTKITQLDASNWNTSKVTGVRWMFKGASNIHTINVSGWDMTNVKNNVIGFQEMFYMTTKLKKIIGINTWKPNVNVATYTNMFTGSGIEELDLSGYTGVVGNASAMFYQCKSLHTLNVSDLDVSQCGVFDYCFGLDTKLKELDLTKWNMSSATSTHNMFWRNISLKSIVGGRNIDDVIINNIGVMNGVKQLTPSIFVETQGLDRASLRAIINGLADLTGQTAKTLTLGATLRAKITEEDIAVATAKNWTIV